LATLPQKNPLYLQDIVVFKNNYYNFKENTVGVPLMMTIKYLPHSFRYAGTTLE
jgi:hypothetical protein